MSLYHETADILSASSPAGGNIKTRIFNKDRKLKSPPQTIYALASETCKWSSVLKEVIENSELLRHERKLTPLLALLLVHDFLLARKGIALPATHGLRTAIERHKARLAAELTRARLRRKATSLDALRQLVAVESAGEYPRWVRVNTLKTTVREQLDTTFKDFTQVDSVQEVVKSTGKSYHVDEHVPNLLALSPLFEITKTQAYTSGAVILQDKASCFPAYLLDPRPENGDVIDSCAAPGNKTTHVAALVKSHVAEGEPSSPRKVFAFEKDPHRGRTLEKMVNLAGAQDMTLLSLGRDFLKVDPQSPVYKNVGALLLDPSCSGSGIVGRDVMPTIHLPERPGGTTTTTTSTVGKKRPAAPDTKDDSKKDRKRKRVENDDEEESEKKQVLVDDDGQELVVSSEKEMKARLEALSSFQLTLLLHAFTFPAARRVTYSTCSIHAEENEKVVLRALESDVAVKRGWRILKRDQQVRGLRQWPVRGSVDAAEGDEVVAEGCIRSHQDDGRGVMGFFVAGFVRDVDNNEQYVVQRQLSVSKTKNENKSSRQEEDGNILGSEDVDGSDADEWGGFDD
ncbi:S-adenosyl-L-methionine-dependent methyltransferase [Poronia punctata]|nr:S-adenosyl-L-methionine-dependent methyltransferase [Poronia punctata]